MFPSWFSSAEWGRGISPPVSDTGWKEGTWVHYFSVAVAINHLKCLILDDALRVQSSRRRKAWWHSMRPWAAVPTDRKQR